MKKVKLSAFVIVRNEEKNIERCLKALDFCDEIIVVDQRSTDRTVEIAKKYADKIVIDQAWGYCEPSRVLGAETASGEWLFNIDADEEVTPELKEEMLEAIKSKKYGAYRLDRRLYYFGKFMKYSSDLGDPEIGVLRLHKRNAVKYSHQIHIDAAPKKGIKIGKLNNPMNHYSYTSFKQQMEKFRRYSRIKAEDRKYVSFPRKYLGIFYVPVGYFLYSYLYQKNILNGFPGFLFSCSIFYHELLVFKYLWIDNFLKKVFTSSKLSDRLRYAYDYVPGCKRMLEITNGEPMMANYYVNKAKEIDVIDINGKETEKFHGKSQHIHFKRAKAENFPFDDSAFDAVTIIEDIDNVRDKDKTISEIYRILKPNGVLVFSASHKKHSLGSINTLIKNKFVIDKYHVGGFLIWPLIQFLNKAVIRPIWKDNPPKIIAKPLDILSSLDYFTDYGKYGSHIVARAYKTLK